MRSSASACSALLLPTPVPSPGADPVFDLILGAAVALGLAGYLVVTLVRPEKF
jgi:K+-transporting ATPase KdpF subunit